MRKLFLFVGSILFCGISYAAHLMLEAPIKDFGTPVTISISTSTWTKVPSSQTSGRTGVILDLPATLNANVVGHLGNCTSTSIATTIRPLEFIRGNAYITVPIREDVCLWLLSIHTGAESVHYQEIKQ